MISIIVPIYKVERYLRQCIDSILNQTYRDLEILLIDDGSPDKCGEICEEYAKTDSRIRVFRTENKGLSAARNLGLQEAKGDFIGFVDSDDWIEPDMYEILLRRIEETNSDIIESSVRYEYMKNHYDKIIQETVYDEIEAIRTSIYDPIRNVVWNKLYKKTCWNNITFPENHLFEGTATLYKVFLNTHLISCISDLLYHYRIRNSSIVHTRTMDSFKEYWNTYIYRFYFLSALPEFMGDQLVINKMKDQIACAADRTWRWIYTVPKEQRDYVFLYNVSCFVRKNFPLFGRKGWKIYLRISIFLSRHVNELSFAVLYAWTCLYKRISAQQQNFP